MNALRLEAVPTGTDEFEQAYHQAMGRITALTGIVGTLARATAHSPGGDDGETSDACALYWHLRDELESLSLEVQELSRRRHDPG
ncbi:hypothetical protein [Thioalkalivibrio paradoxus]|uniref:Uncharacterized protein n=1 Tax=Thioalkalivibrio paradoxus ARh 1 TaxID=713585 RepID=W0DJZ0_9GAMM|nr:hypothetical protein [Thioalkalivibrio paradoxus]AHE97190.1 hypothetical protein THITH_01650 [Thioalkalivibrio paradoxus ARh 1]